MLKSLIFLSLLLFVPSLQDAGDPGSLVGTAAPDFLLPAATKDSIQKASVRLSDIVRENTILLAFYPADWSGGCTKEMCDFRDQFGDFEEFDADIFAISGDYVFTHHQWAKELNLPFTLLSDHSHETARKYHSFNEQTGYNLRTIFVINREGIITYADPRFVVGNENALKKLRKALENAR